MDQIIIGILGGIIGILGLKLISKGLDIKEMQELEKNLGKVLIKKENIDEQLERVDLKNESELRKLESEKKEDLNGQKLADFFNNRKQ